MRPFVAEHTATVAELCRRYGVVRLELFGPAATDTDDAESDLDFLVAFRPLPEGSYADAYFGLMEDLEALFQRPIDLVVASAIRNRYFQQSIDQTKTLLYAA